VALVESTQLLRAFAWARLALAGLLLVTVPLTASEFAPVANVPILALALLVTAGSSAAILLRRAAPDPRRVAALISTLDVVLITAVVTATGGPRSIYPFLYVLSVTGACALLPRVGALAVAALASLLYSGLVFGRTVFPVAYFFETPLETTALEVVTIFLNSATFLVVAILVGGVAERYRAANRELQTRQRDLRDLEAFRDLVFECVGTGLVVLDRGDRVTAFNRAAAEITGRSGSAILGAAWQDIAGDGIVLSEVRAVLGATTSRSVRREPIVYRPDGEAVPVLMTFSTLRSAAGDPLGMVAACEDLSTIRRMEARMQQADRLASLGRMSANIAHEIRNPLASMTGAIEALTAKSGLGQDDRDRLTQIVMSESDRLNSIISDFLAYASPRPLALERIDVAGVLEEVLMLLEHRPLPPTVKVVRAFEAPLSAHADPNALRQALWNLCLNAVDAMPNGGELTVGATVLASTLHLSVADTGRGIAPADVSHIFEPFYSTKPEGSGLGLALVHRIVRDHDGDVEVRTDPRTGTIFTLTLPCGVHV
jgi:two-component system sensor histidine kinase PilS (NtrC family)